MRNTVGEILALLARIKLSAAVVAKEKRLEVVDVGIVNVAVRALTPGVGEFVVIVIDVHVDRDPHLFQIAFAERARGLVLRLAQSGEQHPGEDGDNGNDDEKLNECERVRRLTL